MLVLVLVFLILFFILIVGLVFAASGISGMISSFAFGRMDTRGREWAMLVWPMVAIVPVVGILLVAAGQASVPLGVGLLVVEMLLVGLLIGPMDIALFTVRQRRTDQAWMGRAFAVSMAFNYLGMPVGAALAGLLADRSIELAIVVLGIGGSILAAAAAAVAWHTLRAARPAQELKLVAIAVAETGEREAEERLRSGPHGQPVVAHAGRALRDSDDGVVVFVGVVPPARRTSSRRLRRNRPRSSE